MAGISYIGRSDLPRGLRDNNPGNIKTGIDWQGRVGSDGPFIVFKDMSWGLRALATDIANKIRRGDNSIRKIVNDYAPPIENNTAAYIQSVSDDAGIGPDVQLPADVTTLAVLVRAIANHELGEGYSYDYISVSDIQNGIQMMSDSLKTFFRALGVAALSTVEDPTGQVDWKRVVILVAAVGGGIYIVRKIKW